jgi:hypothetical protein
LYDNLIRRYPDIRLVFSGHTGIAGGRLDTGDGGGGGNSIASFLGTFHSATTNPIQIVDIDTASNTEYAEYAFLPRSRRPSSRIQSDGVRHGVGGVAGPWVASRVHRVGDQAWPVVSAWPRPRPGRPAMPDRSSRCRR